MNKRRKSLEIINDKTIYKDGFGKVIDKETWLKITENKIFTIYDISNQRNNG